MFERYIVLATTAHAARYGHLPAIWGDRMSASIRASIANGQRYSAVEWQRAHDWRTTLFRAVQGLFERYDVIATPTMIAPPKPVDAEGSIATEAYAEWAAPLYPFNLSSHPAMSVPAGMTRGRAAGRVAVGRPVVRASSGCWMWRRCWSDCLAGRTDRRKFEQRSIPNLWCVRNARRPRGDPLDQIELGSVGGDDWQPAFGGSHIDQRIV